MQYFCSCRICKINPGGGKWLSTKKTFKKHQEKEKACIEKINESETESSSESISSYNVAEKRKFDELDKSDINSVNSLSDNESSLDNEDDNNNPSQEDYNGDNDNPSQDYNNYNEDYNNYNENYNGDNDNSSLDEDNGNNNNPNQDYDCDDNPSLDNDENDKLKKKINNIIPFKPQKYDTCKNSCIAFTSLYENLTTCPICNENRFDDNSKPVNTTFFFSLKERLIIQYKDKERAEELQYRNTYFQTKGENGENEKMYADIFDGMLYQDLLQRNYFKDERDIALSGSCDGYQIFEQKTDDLKELQEFEGKLILT
ncbi:hypothetical protein RhiirA1_543090 [Rhizophagus irregularis]|uniref:Uncharacterized protein n=2 Tax=Rhizophagus irregularis TaxID=588596 RepID=A0A2N0QRW0_9GLOM|nr:hypothetical protein RhiirA1_543090 [Rhizophagus irregularis]